MNCFSSICSVCSVANSDSENNYASRNNLNNNNNSNSRSHRFHSIFHAFEKTLSRNTSCISDENIKKFKLHHPDISRYCCCFCIKNNKRKISPYPNDARISAVSNIESKGTPIIPIVTPPEMYVKKPFFNLLLCRIRFIYQKKNDHY